MNGSDVAYLAAGVVVGVVFALVVIPAPASEGACCKRVASGIRDKVEGSFGSWVTSLGDRIDLWPKLTGVAA